MHTNGESECSAARPNPMQSAVYEPDPRRRPPLALESALPPLDSELLPLVSVELALLLPLLSLLSLLSLLLLLLLQQQFVSSLFQQ